MKFLVLGSVNIDETYRVEHIVKEGETMQVSMDCREDSNI